MMEHDWIHTEAFESELGYRIIEGKVKKRRSRMSEYFIYRINNLRCWYPITDIVKLYRTKDIS
jgi:hypothetical protein